MIVKLNDRSSELGVVDYLLSPYDRFGRPRFAPPEIIHGKAPRIDAGIRACDYSQPYLSGELSWEEDLNKDRREKAVKCALDLVSLLAADLPLPEFTTLLVLHLRRKGFDIHFVMLKVHLRTLHQFRFYRNTPADQALLRTWRRRQNLSHGWSDPEDPEHRSLRSHPSRYDKLDYRLVHQDVDQHVVQWVRNGLVRTHSELVAMLRGAGAKIEIVPDGLKATYEGQILTLLGGKYVEGFDYESARSDRATRRGWSRAAIKGEIAGLDDKLHTYRPRRAVQYAAEFAGGNEFFGGMPPEDARCLGAGFSQAAGTADGSGAAELPNPGTGTSGESARIPQEGDSDSDVHDNLRGHITGAGVAPSAGGPEAMGDLAAAEEFEPKGGEPTPSSTGDNPARPTVTATASVSLPKAEHSVGGGGTGNPTGTHDLPIRQPRTGQGDLANPAQGISTTPLNSANTHDSQSKDRPIRRIIAHLVQRVGSALSSFEQQTGEAECLAERMLENANREREALDGIVRLLPEPAQREPDAAGGEPATRLGNADNDQPLGAAVSHFGEVIDALESETALAEMNPIARPTMRPLTQRPSVQHPGPEPSR